MLRTEWLRKLKRVQDNWQRPDNPVRMEWIVLMGNEKLDNYYKCESMLYSDALRAHAVTDRGLWYTKL